MAEQYETLLHRWFEEVWNQGDEAAIDEIFPDGLAHGLGNEPVRGAEGYKPFFRAFKEAFPDIKIKVEDCVIDGDKIAVNCRAAGTHQGLGIGFAPTNQSVDFSFMAFIRIEDNKIVEAWNILDSVKMYQQLGVLSFRDKNEEFNNQALIRRWFEEVWNNKREELIDEMLDEECIHHGLNDEPVVGIQNFKQFFQNFTDAFPNIHVDIKDVVTEGDKIAARYIVTGTHLGKGLGFERTERAVEFTGAGICQVKNGKFVEVWNEVNFLKMFQQLGIVNLGTE